MLNKIIDIYKKATDAGWRSGWADGQDGLPRSI